MEALELLPLCEVRIDVGEAIVVENTPTGNLMVGEITDSIWEGERLRARQRGRAAADWLDVAPDGTARVDVRMTLETHDGALLFVEYGGRSDLATGLAYSAPTFRTGDPRYRWLNKIQAIAKGIWLPEEMKLHYPMVYELR